MIRRAWAVLMAGDPLLVMVTVFCGAYAALMILAIVVVGVMSLVSWVAQH